MIYRDLLDRDKIVKSARRLVRNYSNFEFVAYFLLSWTSSKLFYFWKKVVEGDLVRFARRMLKMSSGINVTF